jgi:type II secretory pathway component PulJ
MFLVVFFRARFLMKNGDFAREQPGAPVAPKKNSQLVEFRLKAKMLQSVNAKMLQPRQKTTNAHTGASPVADI